MSKVIDNVVAHFDSQDTFSFEVPEWGDDNGPLVIYVKPLTLQESKKLYAMSNNVDLEVMVYSIITKALDSQGNNLFTIADKDKLMNHADVTVLAEVSAKILGTTSPEEASLK
tara:strand:+ start:73 stop:411 length:339 start_codon:yes stop_codon:yes gene_type:complete